MSNTVCNQSKDQTAPLNVPNITPNFTLSIPSGCGLPQGTINVGLSTSASITAVTTATATGTDAAIINDLVARVEELQALLAGN